MDAMIADPKIDVVGFDKHDARILRTLLAATTARPAERGAVEPTGALLICDQTGGRMWTRWPVDESTKQEADDLYGDTGGYRTVPLYAALAQPATDQAAEVEEYALGRLAEMVDSGRIDAAYGNFSHPAVTMIADVRKMLPALRTLATQPATGRTMGGEKYRHVKRGTVYEVVGTAELQTTDGALVDGSSLIVYRGDDGRLWAREEGEFHDGRFAALQNGGE
jgi:hypothetical protein